MRGGTERAEGVPAVPEPVDLRARTADVAPGDRVEYWMDLVSREMLPLEAGPPATAAFAGRIRAVRLGATLVCDIAAQPHAVRRTRCLISRTEVACYKVALPLQGSCLFVQEG